MTSQNVVTKQKKKKKLTEIPEGVPVLPALSNFMTVDLVLGENNTVSILHTEKLPLVLKWVEYDYQAARLTLMYQDGRLQTLGVKVPETYAAAILANKNIALFRTNGTKIEDAYMVPVLSNAAYAIH